MAQTHITWLGQAGLLLERDGFRLMIDPYLSDSCGKVNPRSHRRVPVDPKFLAMQPDAILCTHDHLDHTDPETLGVFLNRTQPVTVLAPGTAWTKARAFGGPHNYVQFERHTRWTAGPFRLTAVKAAHSDPAAIGVLIEDGDRRLYVTGDTLYNTDVLADIRALGGTIDAVFLPVNGVGNNMNMTDAADFAAAVGARAVVPLHIGLFDDLTADAFCCAGKVVPEFFKEIAL